MVLALLGLALVIANIHNTSKQQAHLQNVKSAIPYATTPKTTTSSTSSSSDEELILNPIIDLSGWQLPQDIDYDVLSNHISGAIVRVFGGSLISKDSNAASSNGVDKSFKTHIKELKKRDVPVAVYSYAQGTSVKEMKEEARIFYKNASPYKPTYYWIDVEEETMSNMEQGVQPFSLSSNDLELKMLVSILVLISCSSKKFQLKTSTLFGFQPTVPILVITRLYQTLKSTMTFTSIRLKEVFQVSTTS